MAILRVFQIISAYLLGMVTANVSPHFPILSGGFCAVISLSNVSGHPGPDGVQFGAATLWGHDNEGGPRKWEDLYVKGLTVIPYCFPNAAHRVANVNRAEAAIKLWMTALGGKASKSTGHKILFFEWTDSSWLGSSQPLYCIDVNSPVESKWNLKVPYKTVAIWIDSKKSGKNSGNATVGMSANPGKPWDLNLWMSDDASITTVAHELGHVMGKFVSRHRNRRTD